MARVAVVELDRCVNGTACDFLCANVCPVNRAGKDCIVLGIGGVRPAAGGKGHGHGEGSGWVSVPGSSISGQDVKKSKPIISEELCIGCNICVQKCPVDCIYIENLVQELSEPPSHRFGENAFRVYRLPSVKKGEVVGLIGRNGIGKSTILKILSGQIVPNLGDYTNKSPDYGPVISFFRGREIQSYFTMLKDKGVRVSYKPQNIAQIPKVYKGNVEGLLKKAAWPEGAVELSSVSQGLNLQKILGRDLSELSGGELQRVAIAAASIKDADFYAFDEPTSYLDIRERLNAAKIIRSLAEAGKGVVVIEHDLAVLDYMSDYVNLLYGKKSAYGIVSNVKSVRNGINEFLDGKVKDENVRFRKEELRFDPKPPTDYRKKAVIASYQHLKKTLGPFSLEVSPGELREGEVLGIMGSNGIGKTTFVKMLAGVEKPDSGPIEFKMKVSYKPQYLSPEQGITVEQFLSEQDIDRALFRNEVDRRLAISDLQHHRLDELSGGELQKLAVGVALARNSADLILLDEPTAFVDIEDRLNMAEAIRSITSSRKKVCMVVDHDLLFQDHVSDRLIIFEGEPSIHGMAQAPMQMREGMNHFLRHMQISFRRDHESGRPRANKPGSQLDQEQKRSGEYYYVA